MQLSYFHNIKIAKLYIIRISLLFLFLFRSEIRLQSACLIFPIILFQFFSKSHVDRKFSDVLYSSFTNKQFTQPISKVLDYNDLLDRPCVLCMPAFKKIIAEISGKKHLKNRRAKYHARGLVLYKVENPHQVIRL